jgi:hypothetical protein
MIAALPPSSMLQQGTCKITGSGVGSWNRAKQTNRMLLLVSYPLQTVLQSFDTVMIKAKDCLGIK